MTSLRPLLGIAALGAVAALVVPISQVEAYNAFGVSLGPNQRDFRVNNNFEDSGADNNQTPGSELPRLLRSGCGHLEGLRGVGQRPARRRER